MDVMAEYGDGRVIVARLAGGSRKLKARGYT